LFKGKVSALRHRWKIPLETLLLLPSGSPDKTITSYHQRIAVMAGSGLQVSKPMSVKEISAKAQDFDFNPFIALKYWLRTADTLLREVGQFPWRPNQY
jgi:hypothetical protein